MTEPQKMGLKEVMELARNYGYSDQRDERLGIPSKLQLALTTIIESRDRAVRDRGELIALFNDVDRVVVGRLIADRDALAQRVKEIEGAVNSSWRQHRHGGYYYCAFCGNWEKEHAPDCIVLTVTHPQL